MWLISHCFASRPFGNWYTLRIFLGQAICASGCICGTYANRPCTRLGQVYQLDRSG